MYEELGLIPEPQRKPNGYRIFTDIHISQFNLARTAFKIEVLQNGLRKKIIAVVKESAKGNFDEAIRLTDEYILTTQQEINNAKEAVEIVRELICGQAETDTIVLKRKEVSKQLGISMDTLRNWEMNGLLKVKRKSNGYRIYTSADIKQIKIIRSLRCANYSVASILRMLNALSSDNHINIQNVLNTPHETEDIISVCDKLIVSLRDAKANARKMLNMIEEMKNEKNKNLNPPL